VNDQYADLQALEPQQDYIKCGRERGQNPPIGCGQMIKLEEYLENHQVCPHCGRRTVLDAGGWIQCLTDRDSFFELNRDLDVSQLLEQEAAPIAIF
jgi:acetyl-CoA carboxylase beta subunit